MRGPRIVLYPLALVLTLSLAACAGIFGGTARLSSPDAVAGKVWQWEAMVTPVEKLDVPAPERYTFELLPDGKVAARLDCNRGFGSYRIGEGTISFSPMAATRAACEPGSLDGRYSRDLGRAVSFFVEGGKLYLELPVDSGTMRFRRRADRSCRRRVHRRYSRRASDRGSSCAPGTRAWLAAGHARCTRQAQFIRATAHVRVPAAVADVARRRHPVPTQAAARINLVIAALPRHA